MDGGPPESTCAGHPACARVVQSVSAGQQRLPSASRHQSQLNLKRAEGMSHGFRWPDYLLESGFVRTWPGPIGTRNRRSKGQTELSRMIAFDGVLPDAGEPEPGLPIASVLH